MVDKGVRGARLEGDCDMLRDHELSDPSRRTLLSLIGIGALVSTLAPAAARATVKSPRGLFSNRLSGPLRSAGALSFGPDNVLFVGDIAGAAVHAFAFSPADFSPQTGAELGNLHNFEGRDLVQGVDQKVAALLGTTADQIVINDMVVHAPTQQILFSVERGRSIDAVPLLAKVNRGRIELVDLSRVTHSAIPIPGEPTPSAMMEFYPQRSFAITDIKYHDGEIFVSGVSNQHFQSVLHRIASPFGSSVRTTSVEIWHPVHGEWETRAPIIRQLIRKVRGETYLFAVYGCTPLVRFPLAALTDGAHVRGEVIGELGYGSTPIDMLTFTSPADHKDYLLVTIDTRSASRIAVVDLAGAFTPLHAVQLAHGDATPVWATGKTQGLLPIRAEHFALLNADWAVQIARHPKTAYRLDVSTVAMPYFFERRDGESEMNFPDGPDPFEYRTHRGDISRG